MDIIMEDTLINEEILDEEILGDDIENLTIHSIRLDFKQKPLKFNPNNHHYDSEIEDPVFEDYVKRYFTACRKTRRYLQRFNNTLKNGFNKKNRFEQMEILDKVDKGIEKIAHKMGFEDYKFQETVRDFKETARDMSRFLIKPIETYLYH